MPTLDVSRMVLLTQREKQKFQDMANSAFNRILSGLVPPSSQQEYEFMKRDPWAYVTSRVKQLPTREEQAEIIQKATEAMPIAFHGSPHKFEKFELSKIGTGEGGQAYGYGLYFAENPEVAKSYQQRLSGLLPEGWSNKYPESARGYIRGVVGDVAKGASPSDAAKWVQHANANMRNYPAEQLASEIADAAKYTKGAMYRVDIPDEQAAKMLDWDKPLSEQAPEVRKAIIPLLDQHLVGPILRRLDPNATAENTKMMEQMTGAQVYRTLTAGFGGRAAHTEGKTSEILNALGIPGIKYLDQGSRGRTTWQVKHPQGGINEFPSEAQAKAFLQRGNEGVIIPPEQTRNFVVFDPKILKDVKRMTE